MQRPGCSAPHLQLLQPTPSATCTSPHTRLCPHPHSHQHPPVVRLQHVQLLLACLPVQLRLVHASGEPLGAYARVRHAVVVGQAVCKLQFHELPATPATRARRVGQAGWSRADVRTCWWLGRLCAQLQLPGAAGRSRDACAGQKHMRPDVSARVYACVCVCVCACVCIHACAASQLPGAPAMPHMPQLPSAAAMPHMPQLPSAAG